MPFFIVNTIALPLLFALVTRSGPAHRFPLLRVGVLAVLVWIDACVLLWHSCHILTLGYLALLVIGSSTVIPDDQAARLSRKMQGVQFPVYILSVLMVSLLAHIHLPVSTFLTSPGEIRLHVEFLLTNNISEAMMYVFLAAALYAFAISPRMRTSLAILAMTTALVVLIYSFALPFGYPMMSGLRFEQIPIPESELWLRALADGAIAAIAAVLVILAIRRLKRGTIVGLLIVLNLAFVATTALTIVGADDSGIGGAGGDHAIDRPLQLSKTEPNVLIIMLDRFMGGFVEGIVNYDTQLKDQLSGFTWFPKTVAAGENSIAGVHPVFGGYDYTPRAMNSREGILRDLSIEAFRILPHNFSQKGYRSNIVNPRGLGFTMAGDCSFINDIDGVNCSHVSPDIARAMAKEYNIDVPMTELSRSNYADLLVLLGSMRAIPYSLKHVLNKKGPWRPFLDHSAGTTLRQWAELRALPRLTGTQSTEKNLNILWNILPHEPYYMGEDCLPKRREFSLSKAQLKKRGATSLFELQHAIAARCSLLLVADYLDWMKAEGVYDNTKIVIVSDHGIVGPVRDLSSRARQGGTTGRDYVRSRSLLLVKERHAQGRLAVSDAFVPNAEVPRIVCEEIGGCTNPFLGDKAIEAAGRDDPFYVDLVPWQFSRQKPDRFVIQQRIMLRGKAPYQKEAWSSDAEATKGNESSDDR